MSAVSREDIEAAVYAAIGEILETTAFELVDPCEPCAPAPDARGATIELVGPPNCHLALWIDEAEARALASATLGEDALDEPLVDATVGELANMIAGHVASRLWTDVCFRLSSPRVGPPDAACTLTVAGEHGKLAVTFAVEEAA